MLVKVICNANRHDFSDGSVYLDRKRQLHTKFLLQPENFTVLSNGVNYSLFFIAHLSVFMNSRAEICFPSILHIEYQAISCVEILTSYLSACRHPVYVVINLPLRSQCQVTAATREGETTLATLITHYFLSLNQLSSWDLAACSHE